MAALELLDTEMRRWSPTFVDKGHNPVPAPAGATIAYATDDANILQLSFTPPAGRTDLPTLSDDGLEGIYVGSGAIGTATVTATPGGTMATASPQNASVTVKESQVGQVNMTFGDPLEEEPGVEEPI